MSFEAKSAFPENAQKLSASWCVDWVTLVGPEKSFEGMSDLIKNLPFDAIAEETNGKQTYSKAIVFKGASGSLGIFMWGGPSFNGYWCFRLYGLGCQELGGDRLQAFVNDAYDLPNDSFKGNLAETHCTRIDFACDLRGPSAAGFIENAIASYGAGQMMHSRKAQPYREYSSPNVLCRHGVRLGSEKSEQYVRVYDKGLETASEPLGQWVRWEAQFNKKMAQVAVDMLLDRGADARRLINKGFDLVSGGERKELNPWSFSCFAASVIEFKSKDRKHVPWYAEFILAATSGDVQRLSSPKVDKTYLKWRGWQERDAVPRYVRAAAEIGGGVSPGQVMDIVLGYSGKSFEDIEVTQRDSIDATICKLVREYIEGSHQSDDF